MSTILDLPSLRPGERVQDTFLVLDAEQKAFEGGACTVLTFGNASGRVPSAPFWDRDQTMIEGVRRGHVVQVLGEIADYRGRRQLRVSSLRLLPPQSSEAELDRLLPSVGDVARLWDTVDTWRAELRAPRLARVVALFFEDADFRRRFGACPASVAGHHAALGGLLQHTVEVAAIGRTIARAAGADPEVVLAGALLHDIGKLDAYRWDGVFDYTEVHHLVGHVVQGALMFERRLDDVPPGDPPCTPAERQLLLHLILSHHGRLEYGSPVPPLTLEAEVLHWADNASARTASMAEALRDADAFSGGPISQKRFWQLDNRRPYRGASDWGRAAPPTETDR
ncbi:MAG TPA: HD domain-containing protein [Gemmatimonadales bacterium]|nr:HD domain-containing protein [Gemmatimonadales bacterium]